jgi:hypothetical protein
MSRKHVLLLGIGLILILTLGAVIIWFRTPGYTVIRNQDFEGVIFSKVRAVDLLGVMLLNEHDDDMYWTPTEDDIIALEKRIREYAAANLPALDPHLSLVKRQYYGFVRQESPIIMVVGFCDVAEIDWHRELVTLPATSGCYVEAQYDVINDVMLYAWASFEQ